MEKKLSKLRTIINENLRTQIGGKNIEYINSGHALSDVMAKQSHCIFARRGCGKTLLLHHSTSQMEKDLRVVYINCEDFKHHSFPNVLIEILEKIFHEMERNLSAWFGRKKELKNIITGLIADLEALKNRPDSYNIDNTEKHTSANESKNSERIDAGLKSGPASASASSTSEELLKHNKDLEQKYQTNENKLTRLNHNLPKYKESIRRFFELSSKIKSVFIQLDDFYQLGKSDQPFVADYVHRICKDTPLRFKIATLKHNSVLYIERSGQPIGIQERHDFQPINIDFTFEDFARTRNMNRDIFLAYAKIAGISEEEFDGLFKGKGFDRLIMAGGGVPRDGLSFFLDVIDNVRSAGGDGRIGKDDVRLSSRTTFERRIEELKQDSEGQDQEALLRGVHAIREFCFKKKSNVFCIADSDFQSDDEFKILIYRLLDYRVIHRVANSITHKTHKGLNYQAFAIDIGCYAYMRNLHGKLTEIDFSESDAKDKMRSAPILSAEHFRETWKANKEKVIEDALNDQEVSA